MSDRTKSGLISNIQKYSTEDGPGIRTTVFMKGCPLHCFWCHNPESISTKPQLIHYRDRCLGDNTCLDVCPNQALSSTENGIEVDRTLCEACGTCATECPANALEIIGTLLTVEQVMDEVLKDTRYYQQSQGGVTFSGGEPTLQHQFLKELLRAAREEGIHTALDTCGEYKKSVYDTLLPYVDLVLYDLKTLDADKLQQTTGSHLDHVIDNLLAIDARGIPIWIRTPVIPGFSDTAGNIDAITRFVGSDLRHVARYDLLAFSNLCQSKYEQLNMKFLLKDHDLLHQDDMMKLKEIALNNGLNNVVISGPMKNF